MDQVASNNRHLFLAVLGDGQLKIRVLVDLVPGENPFSGWQMAVVLLCLPMVERKLQTGSLPLFIRTSVGPHLAGLIGTSSTPTGPTSKYHYIVGYGFSLYILRDTNIQSMTPSNACGPRRKSGCGEMLLPPVSQ